MNENVPRYEFRIFGTCLGSAEQRLRALAPCDLMFDQLLVNGAAIQSIAIESGDLQAVLEAQSALRLEDCENLSYPLAIARILGIIPLPREEDYV